MPKIKFEEKLEKFNQMFGDWFLNDITDMSEIHLGLIEVDATNKQLYNIYAEKYVSFIDGYISSDVVATISKTKLSKRLNEIFKENKTHLCFDNYHKFYEELEDIVDWGKAQEQIEASIDKERSEEDQEIAITD